MAAVDHQPADPEVAVGGLAAPHDEADDAVFASNRQRPPGTVPVCAEGEVVGNWRDELCLRVSDLQGGARSPVVGVDLLEHYLVAHLRLSTLVAAPAQSLA